MISLSHSLFMDDSAKPLDCNDSSLLPWSLIEVLRPIATLESNLWLTCRRRWNSITPGVSSYWGPNNRGIAPSSSICASGFISESVLLKFSIDVSVSSTSIGVLKLDPLFRASSTIERSYGLIRPLPVETLPKDSVLMWYMFIAPFLVVCLDTFRRWMRPWLGI